MRVVRTTGDGNGDTKSRGSAAFWTRRKRLGLLAFAALLISAVYAYLSMGTPAGLDQVSFPQGVGLCSHFGVYQVPFVSAMVDVHASAPLAKIDLYVNGTFAGTSNFASNSTTYSTEFTANPSTPIIAGKTYLVTFLAAFRDGRTETKSFTVTAC